MAVTFAKLNTTAQMAKAIAKSGALNSGLDEVRRYYGGPSFDSLALEYLFSSSTFPLGVIAQIFGPEGSGKSTLTVDLLNRLFMRVGGDAHLIDTEQKINESLMHGIIDEEALEGERFAISRAPTLERAQSVLITLAKEINNLTHGSKRDSNPHLLGIGLDSFRVASQATVDAVLKAGYASKAFALEANLWRQFLGAFMSLMQYVPMSLIVVNHQVEKESATGYGKVYDVGGGMALKFYETYRLQVKAIKKVAQTKDVYTDLAITSFKNSNGAAKQTINPRIVYKSPDLPEGKIMVDWVTADARLLTGQDIPRSKLTADGVINVKESSTAGLYNEEITGMKRVPISDITQALYEDADRLARFRKILGITVNKTIDELYEDGWFKNAKASVPVSED